MKKLFKRYVIEGEKGTVVNLLLFFILLFGFTLIITNIVTMMNINNDEGFMGIIGSMEFVDNPNSHKQLFYLGIFFVLLSIFLKFKFKVESLIFAFAFFVIFTASMIQRAFLYYDIHIPFLILLSPTLLFFSYMNFKTIKNNKTSAIFTVVLIFISTNLFGLNIIGSVYNKIDHINHNRLEGNHPVFSSIIENCSPNEKFNWFKYNLIPIKEPCYFERYMDKDEKLTESKNRLLSIYYGGIIDLSNFITQGHHNAIKDYSEKEAILLYQISYEAIEKRLQYKTKPKLREIQKLFIEKEKETYSKSKILSNDGFIQYLENKGNEISILSSKILHSLNNKKTLKDEYKTPNIITYNDLIRYKNDVYNSKKSTLFGDGLPKDNDFIFEYSNLKPIQYLVKDIKMNF